MNLPPLRTLYEPLREGEMEDSEEASEGHRVLAEELVLQALSFLWFKCNVCVCVFFHAFATLK